jgi:hypothetical protein
MIIDLTVFIMGFWCVPMVLIMEAYSGCIFCWKDAREFSFEAG